MPDPLGFDSDDSGQPIAGFAPRRRAVLSDAEVGLTPRRQAGLGAAGLPRAGYVIDPPQRWPGKQVSEDPASWGAVPGGGKRELADAPWLKDPVTRPAKLVPVDHNPFDQFDPDKYLKETAPPFDPSKPYESLPDAPWVKAASSIPFVGSARDWAREKINPSEPHGTSIFGTPVSKPADTYSGTVNQYAKEALRDVGKGWSSLMEATDPRRTTPSPVGTPSALAQMAGGIGRAAISPATALVNPAWEYLTGVPG
jgi:hypothetical protein